MKIKPSGGGQPGNIMKKIPLNYWTAKGKGIKASSKIWLEVHSEDESSFTGIVRFQGLSASMRLYDHPNFSDEKEMYVEYGHLHLIGEKIKANKHVTWDGRILDEVALGSEIITG